MRNTLRKLLEHIKNRRVAANLDKSITGIQDDMHKFTTTIRDFEKQYGHKKEAYDFSGIFVLVRLSMIDILILQKHLLFNKVPRERNLFARFMALQIYEFLDDIGQLFGNRYKQGLEAAPENSNLQEDLKALRKLYNHIKPQLMPKLSVIRNNIVAHRDMDALKQEEAITAVDVEEIIKYSVMMQLIYISYKALERKLIESIKEQVQKDL